MIVTACTSLAEVAAALRQHQQLLCEASVEIETGLVSLTLTLRDTDQPSIAEAADVLECGRLLKLLADIGQVRAIAASYGVDAKKLEAMLPLP